MRKTYQYNKKGDRSGVYGHSAAEAVYNHVRWKESRYSNFLDSRGIEDQVETISMTVGNLCDLLISKGLITPAEFLEVLGLGDTHEVRDNAY